MKKRILSSIVPLLLTFFMAGAVSAEQTIQLSTINWPPYTGESLPGHGFFSEIVTEAFSRVGYRVDFQYRPWTRALQEAKDGNVHGVMTAYWKEDRVKFLEYPDVVWKVEEDFIALKESPLMYTGNLDDLNGSTIGALRGSAQAKELESAGIKVESVTDPEQNVRKLLAGRINAMLTPELIFFHLAETLDPQLDRTQVKILTPPYQVYDMYVAFSKQKPDYAKLTADFNRGLELIKTDGSYEKILEKHRISVED